MKLILPKYNENWLIKDDDIWLNFKMTLSRLDNKKSFFIQCIHRNLIKDWYQNI